MSKEAKSKDWKKKNIESSASDFVSVGSLNIPNDDRSDVTRYPVEKMFEG